MADIHLGSNTFLHDDWARFIQWLNGNYTLPGNNFDSGRVKYIVVAGDIVDGIGVYPDQEAELEIADIYAQYEKLAQMEGKVILDTHCSVSTPRGFFPGVPLDYLRMLKVEALVLITADVAEVAKRRSEDETRKRDVDDIGLHDSMNRSYLATYSAATGAPAVVIFNRQGKLEEAVAQLQNVLG